MVRLLVGVGDENVPLHADCGAAGNSAFGWAARPRLANAALKASMFSFAVCIGPKVTKCSPCSPAQVDPIVFDDPYQNAGCGRCRGRSAIGTLNS